MKLNPEKFLDRYPQVLPSMIPAGDFMLHISGFDRRNGSNEMILNIKVYISIFRNKGSRVMTPMDFLNFEWRRFKIPKTTILEKKVENYTSLLDLPIGTVLTPDGFVYNDESIATMAYVDD